MSEEIRIEIPPKANHIVKTIQAAGFEAYVVGGCVRDSILGREPMDWDITTSARPEEVKALFPRTVDTGLAHGTVTVMQGSEGFEVTTYRIDGKYEDGRHPTEVIFTPSLEEDLKRRDFTINAMAYNEESGLVDLFGGLDDIRARTIRCVGNPMERFSEDALRMLRAVRFAAQLGYRIADETREAAKALSGTLCKISAERIQTELLKLLVSPHPDHLQEVYALGMTAIFFPEIDPLFEKKESGRLFAKSAGEHMLKALLAAPADKVVRLSLLFLKLENDAASAAEIAKTVLKRLKFDNDTLYKVVKLVRYHRFGMEEAPDICQMRKAMHEIGEDAFPALFEVQNADIAADPLWGRRKKSVRVQAWRGLFEEVKRLDQCVSLKQLALTGADLIRVGYKPGKELGEKLEFLLQKVLEDPELNTQEKLLNILSEASS